MSLFGRSQSSIFQQTVTDARRMTILDLRACGRSADILFHDEEALGIAAGRLQCLSFSLGMDIPKYQKAALQTYFETLLAIDGIRNGRNGADLEGFSQTLSQTRHKRYRTGWATGSTEIDIMEGDRSFVARGIRNLFSGEFKQLSIIGMATLKLDRELILTALDEGQKLTSEDEMILDHAYINYMHEVDREHSKRVGSTLSNTMELAAKGDPDQQVILAYAYFTGRGVGKDVSAAVAWYRRAAEQGHIEAMRFLGKLYRDGLGVTQDREVAFNWYMTASKKGDHEAQANVAWLKENGLGCVRDLFEAVAWYTSSAEGGYIYSFVRLAAYFIDGRVVEKHEELAYALLLYARSADASVKNVDVGIEHCESILNSDQKSRGQQFFYDIQTHGVRSVLASLVPQDCAGMDAYYFD